MSALAETFDYNAASIITAGINTTLLQRCGGNHASPEYEDGDGVVYSCSMTPKGWRIQLRDLSGAVELVPVVFETAVATQSRLLIRDMLKDASRAPQVTAAFEEFLRASSYFFVSELQQLPSLDAALQAHKQFGLRRRHLLFALAQVGATHLLMPPTKIFTDLVDREDIAVYALEHGRVEVHAKGVIMIARFEKTPLPTLPSKHKEPKMTAAKNRKPSAAVELNEATALNEVVHGSSKGADYRCCLLHGIAGARAAARIAKTSGDKLSLSLRVTGTNGMSDAIKARLNVNTLIHAKSDTHWSAHIVAGELEVCAFYSAVVGLLGHKKPDVKFLPFDQIPRYMPAA